MEKTIEEILEESRERAFRVKEQEQEEANQKNRLRNLQEAQIIIASWKKEFQRRKKIKLKISIRREYNSYFDRFHYKLRCFVEGKIYGDFNLEETAGLILISGLEQSSMGGFEFYTIFTNQ